jgi:hypothetical protein
VTPELACEWGEVPAYAQSLEKIRGAGALDRLADEVRAHADATIPLRAAFSGAGSSMWLVCGGRPVGK